MIQQRVTAYCRIAVQVMEAESKRGTELLLSSVGPTRAKRGCVRCQASSHLQGEHLLELVIEWENREGLERHLCSDDFWPVLLAIDLGSQEPEVVIGELLADRGMGSLQRIRASA